MKKHYQIPRNSLIWLLASMFSGIAPHLLRLPVWVTLICLICGVWRVMVYRSRCRLPGRWVKALLVVSGVAAVIWHYGTLMGPDAGSALLILGFSFKLLETSSRRDAFIVVILGYFVVATSFFYSQSIASAVYLMLVAFMVTAALIGLNQTPLQTHPERTARHALKLVMQSLPLMLILFVFVPRVGPLWSLDLGGSSAKTGLSDRITPGDIANLSRSPELAFRVEFDGKVPDQRKLYWRALVLDNYDGRSWTRGAVDMDSKPMVAEGPSESLPWASSITRLGETYRYKVIMEPTDQPWLFSLGSVRSAKTSVASANKILQSRDYRLVAANPIHQPFSYQVESDLDYRFDAKLPLWLAQKNLQLPLQGNPQARKLAQVWFAQESNIDTYVARILAYFAQQPFTYTLNPPLLTKDRIDQFLFESQQGFCTYYAGAFVFMMRAAGIPARIVAGYQGGEYNYFGNYLLVHQFDAHAWAEVWIPGKGWQRVDPTAVVSPSRVEGGIEEALSSEQSFLEDSLFSPLRYRSIGWVSNLRLAWDYVNYTWHRSVLGYDAKRQQDFLFQWIGPVDFKKLGLWLVVGVASVLVVIALFLFLKGREYSSDPLLKLYRKFCRKMAARGTVRNAGEPPQHYAQRLVEQWPDKASLINEFTRHYHRGHYGPNDLALDARIRRMRTLLKSL